MLKNQFDLDVTLSLFDGMSGGQEALKRAGLSTRIYLASEIEKFPKCITRKNHPLTVQIGDVTKVVANDLPHVNLLMGGSPCQGFSFAGKQLNFDDPRSALFFEFVRLLKECKPDYFLLENVMMKQDYQDIISEHLGVKPVMINSSLLSAQNRKRLYWTNIEVTQPKDKGILLKDILQKNLNGDRSCQTREFNTKSLCHHSATATDIKGNESIKRVYSDTGKSPTLTTMKGGHREPKVLIVPEKVRVRKHKINIKNLQTLLKVHKNKSNKTIKQISKEVNKSLTKVEHWFRLDSSFAIPSEDVWFKLKEVIEINVNTYDAAITEFEIRDGKYEMADRVYNPNYKAPTVVASNVSKVLIVPEATKKGYTEIQDGDCFDATFMASKTRRGRNMKDKSNCLTAANYDYMRYEHPTYRKLTPLECSRLQTFNDDYLEDCYDDKGKPISDSQKYRALGNGWTVDVIAHILQGIKTHGQKRYA